MDASLPRQNGYCLVQAPGSSGVFSALVVDHRGRANRPLSWFIPFLRDRYAESTARAYIQSLMRYFSWLNQGDRAWDSSACVVRSNIEEYLISVLHCKTREHRDGFIVVSLSAPNSSEVAIFLAAARSFYIFASSAHIYTHAKPLDRDIQIEQTSAEQFRPIVPTMPLCSGVQQPPSNGMRRRLTQTYFVVKNEEWVPQIIDDPYFPRRILDAGKKVAWQLRERIETRLLFETGARISEICGLTLGDWHLYGLRCDASAFSKGSNQRRVKTLRFSESSAKLLRQYFDYDRRRVDPQNWKLSDYLNNCDSEALFKVPLFLTRQRTAMSPGTFRDLYWRPACQAAGIKANVHQTRHWYVTFAMKEIFARTSAGPERNQRIHELVVYMAWRHGAVTLSSYNHYFDRLQYAAIQAGLHDKLDRRLREKPSQLTPQKGMLVEPTPPSDPDWDLLSSLGTTST